MPQQLLGRLIKNAKKQNDPLTTLVDQYLLKRDLSPNRCWDFPTDIEDRDRPPGRLSPSSLCACERRAAFRFLGVKGKRFVDPEASITLDDGKWRHLRLQWMCKDMEAVLGRDVFRVISIEQFVAHHDLYVAGSLDILVAIYGVPWVIDFKGVNQMGFEWLFNKGEPKTEHLHQVMGYMRLRRVKRGIIWYENKNDGRHLIFTVEWNPRIWKEVQTWCKKVIGQMKRERLPLKHPECRDGRYLYGKCEFAGLCYGGKTEAQIERLVYRNFPGVEALWERGLESNDQEGYNGQESRTS